MDRQLEAPLLIVPVDEPKKIGPAKTYEQLNTFLQSLHPFSPARTQLERLTDALGVETGLIAPSEGDKREARRRKEKSEKKAARRRAREALVSEQEQAERQGLEDQVEGLEDDGEMEQGAVDFEDEKGMDERGDVEYGDEVDDDTDEPDNEDENEKMEVDEW